MTRATHRGASWVYLMAAATLSLLPSCGGDASTSPVRQLHDRCFGGEDCTALTVNARLDLDTYSLPSINGGRQAVLLRGRADHPDWRDVIELSLEDTLPMEVDPGAVDQRGWKVALRGARIDYCETCYTNGGLAHIISLRAPMDSLTFVFDPRDDLPVFIDAGREESP